MEELRVEHIRQGLTGFVKKKFYTHHFQKQSAQEFSDYYGLIVFS